MRRPRCQDCISFSTPSSITNSAAFPPAAAPSEGLYPDSTSPVAAAATALATTAGGGGGGTARATAFAAAGLFATTFAPLDAVLIFSSVNQEGTSDILKVLLLGRLIDPEIDHRKIRSACCLGIWGSGHLDIWESGTSCHTFPSCSSTMLSRSRLFVRSAPSSALAAVWPMPRLRLVCLTHP